MLLRSKGYARRHAQGTVLGVILYILYINPVGFPSEATVKISDVLHNYWNVLDNVPDLPHNDDTLPDSLQSIKFKNKSLSSNFSVMKER